MKFNYYCCAVMAYVVTISTVALANASSDALLSQITKEAASYAKTTFEVTVLNTATADKKRESRLWHFDPAKPAGQRVELMRFNDKAPTTDQLKEFAKDFKDYKFPAGYGIVAGLLVEGHPVKLSETADHSVYRIDKLPADTIQSNQGNYSDKMIAELSVVHGDHPYVDSVTFMTQKPFRAKLVATITNMRFETKFKRRDGGQVIPSSQTQVIRGSTFGNSLDTDSDSKFMNVGNIIPRP